MTVWVYCHTRVGHRDRQCARIANTPNALLDARSHLPAEVKACSYCYPAPGKR